MRAIEFLCLLFLLRTASCAPTASTSKATLANTETVSTPSTFIDASNAATVNTDASTFVSSSTEPTGGNSSAGTATLATAETTSKTKETGLASTATTDVASTSTAVELSSTSQITSSSGIESSTTAVESSTAALTSEAVTIQYATVSSKTLTLTEKLENLYTKLDTVTEKLDDGDSKNNLLLLLHRLFRLIRESKTLSPDYPKMSREMKQIIRKLMQLKMDVTTKTQELKTVAFELKTIVREMCVLPATCATADVLSTSSTNAVPAASTMSSTSSTTSAFQSSDSLTAGLGTTETSASETNVNQAKATTTVLLTSTVAAPTPTIESTTASSRHLTLTEKLNKLFTKLSSVTDNQDDGDNKDNLRKLRYQLFSLIRDSKTLSPDYPKISLELNEIARSILQTSLNIPAGAQELQAVVVKLTVIAMELCPSSTTCAATDITSTTSPILETAASTLSSVSSIASAFDFTTAATSETTETSTTASLTSTTVALTSATEATTSPATVAETSTTAFTFEPTFTSESTTAFSMILTPAEKLNGLFIKILRIIPKVDLDNGRILNKFAGKIMDLVVESRGSTPDYTRMSSELQEMYRTVMGMAEELPSVTEEMEAVGTELQRIEAKFWRIAKKQKTTSTSATTSKAEKETSPVTAESTTETTETASSTLKHTTEKATTFSEAGTTTVCATTTPETIIWPQKRSTSADQTTPTRFSTSTPRPPSTMKPERPVLQEFLNAQRTVFKKALSVDDSEFDEMSAENLFLFYAAVDDTLLAQMTTILLDKKWDVIRNRNDEKQLALLRDLRQKHETYAKEAGLKSDYETFLKRYRRVLIKFSADELKKLLDLYRPENLWIPNDEQPIEWNTEDLPQELKDVFLRFLKVNRDILAHGSKLEKKHLDAYYYALEFFYGEWNAADLKEFTVILENKATDEAISEQSQELLATFLQLHSNYAIEYKCPNLTKNDQFEKFSSFFTYVLLGIEDHDLKRASNLFEKHRFITNRRKMVC